jgi:hypothetical protein
VFGLESAWRRKFAKEDHDNETRHASSIDNTACKFATFRGQRDDKRAAIRFSDLTRNQIPFRQPIQNAGQCRSLMRKATMEVGHFAGLESASIPRMWASPWVNPGSPNLSR